MLFRYRLMRCFKSTLPGEEPVFSQSGSSTPKSPCARQSLNTPRDFLHAKHDPTRHDTQDVRRLLRGPSKSPVDSNWTVRIAHSSRREHHFHVKVV